MEEITQLLQACGTGDAESPGNTLQPTALVNEWMLKMLTGEKRILRAKP